MIRSSFFVAFVAMMGLLASAHGSVIIETVPVGNVGNAPDPATGSLYGSVGYAYNIGKYEVTAGQYTAFLNAVAATDTYNLYNTLMSSATDGPGITRTGSAGSYTYSVNSAFVNRPVSQVSWGDAARFANWLSNGQPGLVTPVPQDLNSTEDGSYFLNGAMSNPAIMAVTRKANATWVIPSEDEWYKASYHKNDGVTGNYFTYPTSSNTLPGRNMHDPLPGNNANYYNGSGTFPIDSGKYTTLVGEFQNSASPYGTFDQGGNVFEWNEAIPAAWSRGLRGGSYYDATYGFPSGDRYTGAYAYLEYSTFGFRVSQIQIPEPASGLVLLALAGVGLMARRQRTRSAA